METHFLSTGAFEITLNGGLGLNCWRCQGKCVVKEILVFCLLDVPLWSKLQSRYVPNIQEIFKILDSQLKMNQVDQMSFS